MTASATGPGVADEVGIVGPVLPFGGGEDVLGAGESQDILAGGAGGDRTTKVIGVQVGQDDCVDQFLVVPEASSAAWTSRPFPPMSPVSTTISRPPPTTTRTL